MTRNFPEKLLRAVPVVPLLRRIIERRQARAALADPAAVPARWLRRPPDLAGRDVCLLVSWTPQPQLAEHAVFLARAWASQGFAVILIVACDDPEVFDPGPELDCCAGIMARANIGYDFGAWAHAIRSLPDLAAARLVAVANDSVFGPFAGFDAFLERARNNPADVVGAIGSLEFRPHLQSFLLFFKPAAVRHPAFSDFWNGVRNGNRSAVIRRYELVLQHHFMRNGVSVAALFPVDLHAARKRNPSLTIWRELIDAGFPFLKIQLLRDNPARADIRDWESVIASQQYDVGIIRRYLAKNGKRPIKKFGLTLRI